MPLSIRSAADADMQAVIDLWRASGLVVPTNDTAADFRFARAGASSEVLVGRDTTGAIKGSLMVGHDGHRGWLYYVAVAPDTRGLGYGRAMVRAGEDWLRDRGVVKVQLLVRDTNTDVVSFYERLGFETAPRVVMAKWLPTPPEAASHRDARDGPE